VYEAKAKAAGLASLDFELPTEENARWTLYRFTAPLGSQEITARSASNDLVWRSTEIVIVVAALLAAGVMLAVIRAICRAIRRASSAKRC
jgi:hypothetical protein